MTALRVLVVDDEPIVARLHETFVSGLDGFIVVGFAATGPDAVTAVRQHRPDVVLLDMRLPGFDGLEVLRQMRTDRDQQPEVIAVTSARDIETVRDARRAGVRHYLAKPFSAHDLRTRLREIREELRGRTTERPLEQAQIDAVMAPGLHAPALPKGLSTQTLDVVRGALVELPDASSVEVAAHVGLSRVSAGKYLEYLADAGVAVRALDYTSTGRPTRRYRLAGP